MAQYRSGQEGKRCGGAFFITTKEGLEALKQKRSPISNQCRLRSHKNGGSMDDWCDLTNCPARGLLFVKSQEEQKMQLKKFRELTLEKLTSDKKYVVGRKSISLKRLLEFAKEPIIWS